MTDPDCGLFVEGSHERKFAYEAHTACDANGFALETVATPGNVHDSVAFGDVYEKVAEAFPEIETVVADSAYKTPHICKKVIGDGRVLSTAYKRPMTMKGGHEWWKYVYDEYYDWVIWKDDEELADDARCTPKNQELYARRKETIERVFPDAKEKHAMRYTQYRGLAQVTNWVKLKFAAMNLKRMENWRWKTSFSCFLFLIFRSKHAKGAVLVVHRCPSYYTFPVSTIVGNCIYFFSDF